MSGVTQLQAPTADTQGAISGGLLRNKLRIKLSEPMAASFRAGAREGRGVVRDVSLGGLFVNSALLLPTGTQIRANLTTASGWSFQVHGVVRWNTNVTTCEREESGF